MSSKIKKEIDDINIELEFMTADQAKIHGSMRFVAQAGAWSLHMFKCIYKIRFDLAGLNYELANITKGL
jgi:hypothetical protein